MTKKKPFSFDVWDHNMIPGVPVIVQKRFSRWLVFTIATVGALFIGLICIDIPLYWALYDVYQNEHILKMQATRFEELLEKKHALKKEEQLLKDRELGFVKKREKKMLLFENITFLKKSMAHDIIISSCVCNSKQLYVVVTGKLLAELLCLYDVLVAERNRFDAVVVQSLVQQTTGDGYIMTLKAILKNNYR